MKVNSRIIIRNFCFMALFFALAACGSEETGSRRQQQTLEPLAVEDLQQLFPTVIPGTRASQPSGGRQTSEGRVLMKASGEYIFNAGGHVRISVTDFTDLTDYMLTYRSQYENFSKNSMEGFTAVKNSNGVGVVQWDPGDRSGTIRFLALDRFGVVIEIIRMPQESIVDARGILESLNFNALKLKT